MTRYLFSYFTSQNDPDGEQVRFARSVADDPLHWEALRGGEPVLRWTGGRGGVRDPFLLRAAGLPGETAAFYLLGTDMRAHGQDTREFWDAEQRHGSRGIVVWESADLVTWGEPRLELVAPSAAGNAWAPEAVFDAERGEYLVFWASQLHGDGAERGDSYNRMLAATTRDFRQWSEPVVWSDPGHSVIDATVVREGEWWYRFVKDERSPASDTPAAKFITVERSRDLRATEWELVQDRVGAGTADRPGVAHGEGPIVVPAADGGPVVLLIDEFGLRRYLPFVGAALDTDAWTLAEDFALPPGASHGSVLAITDEEWGRLSR
ncbi:glycoside hydrolase family 43 protein [Rathayibacter sp. VKM Ac-2927]|uniref:glycoside hydrolase family 43 protein n=1 Tax=Rathayibacter sp. VKM Ac-2927 TaxID=2929478 RepID=UPI001FB38915|nr:glycoside hydrolase family 43 protein [Rathayibacter sp. VKM Ac-2927]MCJ1687487.1 glycoside hydrolase family 43 protein [Rathayibacter sp. VKM Ac-2927]